MTEPKKQRFLQGAAILTIGIVVHKLISAFYKVPLFALIGTESVGHFSVAYSIYEVLMSVSTAGLPVAASRLISEAQTRDDKGQMQRVFHVCLALFLMIGIVGGGAMTLFAAPLARRLNDPAAVYAIRCLGPAVLFVSLFCAFRGYFQGQQYMTPTAVSQIIEAICKLAFGLGLACLAIRLGLGTGELAAAGILGVTIGAGVSVAYLLAVYLRRRPRRIGTPASESVKKTLRRVLYLAVPITVGAAGLQIFKLLGTGVILGRLQNRLGFPLAQASAMLGVYAMVFTLYMLPGAIVQPVGVSVIAAATEKLTADDADGACRLEESALRMTALISLPCGVGMAVLAEPILCLLYRGLSEQELRLGTPLLMLLGIGSIFYCALVISNAILQAHGRVIRPLVHTLLGGALYLLLCAVLVGIPQLHIYGAGLATMSYSLLIPVLNFLALRRCFRKPPRIFRQFVKPVLAACGMGLAVWGCYQLLHSTLLSIFFGAAVYLVLIYLLRALTWEDCQMLPQGARLARLLRVKKPEEGEKDNPPACPVEKK